MAKILVVEIRNSRNELLERRRLDQYPVHIGRAYSNELIIQDRYVCPKHIVLKYSENGLIAEDLKSLNGTFENGSILRVTRKTIAHGTELRIGTTLLSFIDPDEPVQPAVMMRTPEQERKETVHLKPWHAVAVFVCSLLLSALQGYWFEYSAERSPFLKLILFGLIAALLLWLPWAGVWALVGRVMQRQANFSAHVTAIALASYLLGLLWLGTEYAEFAFGSPGLGTTLTFATFALWAFALLRFHLRHATKLPIEVIQRVSGAIALVLVGIAALYHWADRFDFSDELPLHTTLKPPAFQVSNSLSVDAFVERAAQLESKVQSLRDD